MKSIQFKQTNSPMTVGNDVEVFAILGGSITYSGSGRGEDFVIQKTYERDNKCFPLQFDDWIVDINGVIFVLSDEQYRALLSIKRPLGLGEALALHINDAVKKEIERGVSQGGFIQKDQKLQVKVDHDGFVRPTHSLCTKTVDVKWDNPK